MIAVWAGKGSNGRNSALKRAVIYLRDWVLSKDLYFNREYMVEFSDSVFQFFGSDLIAAAMDCDAEPFKTKLFT